MRIAEGYVDQLAILRADTDAYFSPAYLERRFPGAEWIGALMN